jgi:hypothetical protein
MLDVMCLLAGVLVRLCREKGSDLLLGGVSLEYDPTAGPTKFMVGCEQGERSATAGSSYSCAYLRAKLVMHNPCFATGMVSVRCS